MFVYLTRRRPHRSYRTLALRKPGSRVPSASGLSLLARPSHPVPPVREAEAHSRRTTPIATDLSAVIIFVDVRGFTKWAEANEVFINLDRFVEGFMKILGSRFPKYHVKPLGDGAMLLRRVPENADEPQVTRLLSGIIKSVELTEANFAKHCSSFGKSVGHSADLALGWGIVRGKVLEVGDDWAGHNINKASRLCDEARPFGVVIDKTDFPNTGKTSLVSQIRRLIGIGDVPVWVSPEIATRFVTREKLRETPEVHVAGVCLAERDGKTKLLIAKRSDERSLYPGKYEGCGGQLRYSENFPDGVKRHFKTELGLNVDVLTDFHVLYDINVANEPVIPGIRFLCVVKNGNQPRSANHSELRWVTESEFKKIPSKDFVGNLRSETVKLLDRYHSSRAHS